MLQDVWQAIDEGNYRQAESLLRADEDLLTSRAGQMALGYVYAHTDRFDPAREVFGTLRAEHRGDPWEHIAVHQLGRVERLAGQHGAALTVFDEELKLIEALDDPAHERAVNALERAICLRGLGRLDEARDVLRASLDTAGPADPETVGRAERELAALSAERGHPDAARLHLERALVAFREAEDDFAVRDLERRLNGP